MKLGILTSSRADYGIYLPLLKKLKCDPFFSVEIIAFGTHLSKSHGYTISEIISDSYDCIHTISSLISNDDEQAIATSYGLTVLKFVDFWNSNKYDLVFCLGDRFEMSAAVQAGIPFGIKFAHIHGGETTLGAIDNVYRHQITLSAFMHFTATKVFSEKVEHLVGSSTNIFGVGSLSLDGIEKFKPLKKNVFLQKYNIPQQDFALITFHPETLLSTSNISLAKEMREGLTKLIDKLYLVITMPNADTMGSFFRNEIEKLREAFPDRVTCIENFGKINYFTAMYYSKILIGNTSSGILEAASFGKYVVNVGDRQKGRLQNSNVLNSNFSSESILANTLTALNLGEYTQGNIYVKNNTAQQIISIIKKYHVEVRRV